VRQMGLGKTARAKAPPGKAVDAQSSVFWENQVRVRIGRPDVFDRTDIVNIVNSLCGTRLTWLCTKCTEIVCTPTRSDRVMGRD
jgi:hypothetical protein